MPVATQHDITPIRNGVYNVQLGSRIVTFKIHTLTRARNEDLVGTRVISTLDHGAYTAFASLNVDGTYAIWRRWAGRLTPGNYIYEALEDLFAALRNNEYYYSSPIAILSPWHVTGFNTLCNVCNHPIELSYTERGTCRTCGGPSAEEVYQRAVDEAAEEERREERARLRREEAAARSVDRLIERARNVITDEYRDDEPAPAEETSTDPDFVPDHIVRRLHRSPFNSAVIQ